MHATPTGSRLTVVYVLRTPHRRDEFLALMSDLRRVTLELMASAGADPSSYTMTEHPKRPGWFVESVPFPSEKEQAKFDDLYHQDRRTATLQSLLDELVDAARSDYVLTRSA